MSVHKHLFGAICSLIALNASAVTLEELEEFQNQAQMAKLKRESSAGAPTVANDGSAAAKQASKPAFKKGAFPSIEIRSIGGLGNKLQTNLIVDGRELPAVRAGDEIPGGVRVEAVWPRKVTFTKGSGKQLVRTTVMFLGRLPAPVSTSEGESRGAMPFGTPAARLPLDK